MRVMNEALGGLFSSRINLNLREAARLHLRRELAVRVPPIGRARSWSAPACAPTSPAPAVSEIFKEVRRMRETPLSPEELTLAKDSLVRSLPSRLRDEPDA